MKRLQTILMLTAMVFGMTIAAAWADNPNEIADWIKVSFDNPVHVGGTMLQPGNYVLEQMPSPQASQDRGTFLIWHNGKKVAVTNPAEYALDQTANQTRASVAVVNGQRYLYRVNVAGSGYGWNFLAPQTAQAMSNGQKTTEENAVAYTIHRQANQTAQSASVENQGTSNQDNSGTVSEAIGPDRNDQSITPNDQGTTAKNGSSWNNNSSSVNGNNANANMPKTGQQNASTNQAESSNQLVQVLGCVSDNHGDSYLLTKEGQRYQLRGDADNIREYSGRIVTVGGIVNPKTDQFHPMFLTVRELAPTAEVCDSATPGHANNPASNSTPSSGVASNSTTSNTGNSQQMGSTPSNSETQNTNAAASGNTNSQPASVGSSTGGTNSGSNAPNSGSTTGAVPPQR